MANYPVLHSHGIYKNKSLWHLKVFYSHLSIVSACILFVAVSIKECVQNLTPLPGESQSPSPANTRWQSL